MPNVWGIKGGMNGVADPVFVEHNRIAIGCGRVGDFRLLPRDVVGFAERLRAEYPGKPTGTYAIWARMHLWFLGEIQIDDYVVYLRRADNKVWIGQVTGGYEHNPQVHAEYPNLRPVRWRQPPLPKTQFTAAALQEANQRPTLFRITNHANAFVQAAGETPLLPVAVRPELAQPPPPTLNVDEARRKTTDFILESLATKLDGHQFAGFVAGLFQSMDFVTRVAPPGPDGGVDIVARRDELGSPVVKVQVKRTRQNIGDPVVSAFYGRVQTGEFGIFVTLGGFTANATAYAQGQPNLDLVGGDELVRWILKHYEQLAPEHQSCIPLKRMYVPNP